MLQSGLKSVNQASLGRMEQNKKKNPFVSYLIFIILYFYFSVFVYMAFILHYNLLKSISLMFAVLYRFWSKQSSGRSRF